MRLICISDYRAGSVSYHAGQDVDVPDVVAAFLLRDSPGSFRKDEWESEHSEETATEIKAPDRRARGGRKR